MINNRAQKIYMPERNERGMFGLIILELLIVGTLIGSLSAVLGLGGRVLIVPATTLIFHLPIRAFVEISLVGIILFALFPSVRVLLGIHQFWQNREFLNLIIAAILLIELTASILLIFVMKGVLT